MEIHRPKPGQKVMANDRFGAKRTLGEPGANDRFGEKRTLMIETERMRMN
jgi:hypothetical protein